MLESQRTAAQRFALSQLKMLLEENGVPSPYIVWLDGDALLPLMERLGRPPFWKDGAIVGDQLYRYNVDTGRFRKAEPFVRREK
jgi:hypothetical protein